MEVGRASLLKFYPVPVVFDRTIQRRFPKEQRLDGVKFREKHLSDLDGAIMGRSPSQAFLHIGITFVQCQCHEICWLAQLLDNGKEVLMVALPGFFAPLNIVGHHPGLFSVAFPLEGPGLDTRSNTHVHSIVRENFALHPAIEAK